jgi:hypothetical protein
MQMVLLGHDCGYGVTWNHFADDLIGSRPENQVLYEHFAERIGIPPYVAPVAIVAFGAGAFAPPVPARTEISRLSIQRPDVTRVR